MQAAQQHPPVLPGVPHAKAPVAMENQGSGDFSSQDGSHPSCSSSSSDRNHSTGSGLADGADDSSISLLMDDDVRAMLKKVKVNEGVLNKAIQSLGGGEKGLKSLMGYIVLWVKQQKECKSSQTSRAGQSSNPPLNFSMFGPGETALQQESDAFQILNGILQSPPPQVPVEQPDVQNLQRFKSRRLMMGEPGVDAGLRVDTGFYPTNFMSVAVNPEDYPIYKSDITSPGMIGPCMPQLNYEHGMHQPVCNMQPVLPFTTGHTGMAPVEQTPAMATKAARRNRMARQRQSMMNHHHARAASQGCAAPVSVGGGLWNAAPPAGSMKKSGMSHSAAQTPQSVPVTGGRKGRNMDSLTLLLQKELRPSDVGNLGRIILPKKEAEQHMPFLAMRGGVAIQMEDFDTGHSWNLRYSVTPPPKLGSSPLVTSGTSSFWPNNKSRMYLLENTGEFVKSHRLAEGDLLVLYRNQQGAYVLRGKKKKSQRLEVDPVQVKFAHSSAKGSPEEQTSPKENGLLIQRLYGGGPLDKSVKEEPVNLDDDPFLKDMMMSMGPSFGSDSTCLQPLERFPSLNLDFPLDEIIAVTTKTEPEE
ncbi:hypothetical protein KC19_4G250700 [Ceratodon purpureus]|uniref:TF-B3 domain-containing protein n=1 Tax=Ceratodon purpureus TaxID=3225 RepID=A0A8T0IFW5_CERPU|nr:hypothetical protein KC19_4G250700 [Ceratodon purpureus]